MADQIRRQERAYGGRNDRKAVAILEEALSSDGKSNGSKLVQTEAVNNAPANVHLASTEKRNKRKKRNRARKSSETRKSSRKRQQVMVKCLIAKRLFSDQINFLKYKKKILT